MHLHDEAVDRRVHGLLHQIAKFTPVIGIHRIIGVHPKDPFTPRVANRLIAGRGKTIAPGKIIDPCTQPLGNGGRLVFGTSVDNDHLVHPGLDAGKASFDRARIVSNNHAK